MGKKRWNEENEKKWKETEEWKENESNYETEDGRTKGGNDI